MAREHISVRIDPRTRDDIRSVAGRLGVESSVALRLLLLLGINRVSELDWKPDPSDLLAAHVGRSDGAES